MQNAKLIAVSRPADDFRLETGCENAEDLISYCARVSNPDNQENFDTADKLLKYCIRKKHWSIFQMAHVVMEIKCTRDIGRQILRHRSFSFQEFSQRYAKVKIDDFETRECRLQDTKNRQNSIETDDLTLRALWKGQQYEVLRAAKRAYEWAIDKGIAKEQARVVLPEGLTPSTMYMAGSLRDWFHYCVLRQGIETQKEHREVASICWEILQREFPFLETVDWEIQNIDTTKTVRISELSQEDFENDVRVIVVGK